MHDLEYMLLLSERIHTETGNGELADAARQLAGASHDYEPTVEKAHLVKLAQD